MDAVLLLVSSLQIFFGNKVYNALALWKKFDAAFQGVFSPEVRRIEQVAALWRAIDTKGDDTTYDAAEDTAIGNFFSDTMPGKSGGEDTAGKEDAAALPCSYAVCCK